MNKWYCKLNIEVVLVLISKIAVSLTQS